MVVQRRLVARLPVQWRLGRVAFLRCSALGASDASPASAESPRPQEGRGSRSVTLINILSPCKAPSSFSNSSCLGAKSSRGALLSSLIFHVWKKEVSCLGMVGLVRQSAFLRDGENFTKYMLLDGTVLPHVFIRHLPTDILEASTK